MKRVLTIAELHRIWDPRQLRERIAWVLRERDDVVDDETDWSVKAGLNKGHLSMLVKRTQKAPKSVPECRTMAALASAAHVSAGWLAFGEGTADSFGAAPSAASHPNLVRAINLATYVDDEILAETIAEARAIAPGFPGDRPVLEWLDQIRHLDRIRRIRGGGETSHDRDARKQIDRTQESRRIKESMKPPPEPRTHPASASYKTAKGSDDDS